MATFFVGQRVRLTHSLNYPEIIGREYRIAALNVSAWACGLGSYRGHQLDSNIPNGLLPIVAPPDFLEPILPEGHQPCDTEFKRDLDRLLEGVAA